MKEDITIFVRLKAYLLTLRLMVNTYFVNIIRGCEGDSL